MAATTVAYVGTVRPLGSAAQWKSRGQADEAGKFIQLGTRGTVACAPTGRRLVNGSHYAVSRSSWAGASELFGVKVKIDGPQREPFTPRAWKGRQTSCVLEKDVLQAEASTSGSIPLRLDMARKLFPTALSESKIWLSDVFGRKQRPYFLNRSWTQKDLSYVAYMLVVHGLCLAAPFTFSWDALICFMVMYVITGMFGITLSFHRHLSHKSFKVPKWVEYVIAYCGVLAVQGDPLEWVSAHRYHHQHCDTPQDPHTPYEGLWHSHMGWLLDDKTTAERVGIRGNIADMANDPFYKWIEKTYTWHVVGSAALLYVIGGWPYLVWGFALRTVWVYHITWAVNSAAHVWGNQKWNTGDLSRNNWWVALLAFGEGWHNNHHAFEYSARHGLEWWQLDPTWYTVRLLEAAGLASKVRYPTKDHMAKLAMPSPDN